MISRATTACGWDANCITADWPRASFSPADLATAPSPNHKPCDGSAQTRRPRRCHLSRRSRRQYRRHRPKYHRPFPRPAHPPGAGSQSFLPPGVDQNVLPPVGLERLHHSRPRRLWLAGAWTISHRPRVGGAGGVLPASTASGLSRSGEPGRTSVQSTKLSPFGAGVPLGSRHLRRLRARVSIPSLTRRASMGPWEARRVSEEPKAFSFIACVPQATSLLLTADS